MKKKISKKDRRAAWIIDHTDDLKVAHGKYTCPTNCKSACSNGATCRTSSYGGWGFWAQAFRQANVRAEIMNYWSGSFPTPSTSINRGMAEYICANAPKELI